MVSEDRDTVFECDHGKWTSTRGRGWAKMDMGKRRLKTVRILWTSFMDGLLG